MHVEHAVGEIADAHVDAEDAASVWLWGRKERWQRILGERLGIGCHSFKGGLDNFVLEAGGEHCFGARSVDPALRGEMLDLSELEAVEGRERESGLGRHACCCFSVGGLA